MHPFVLFFFQSEIWKSGFNEIVNEITKKVRKVYKDKISNLRNKLHLTQSELLQAKKQIKKLEKHVEKNEGMHTQFIKLLTERPVRKKKKKKETVSQANSRGTKRGKKNILKIVLFDKVDELS